MQLHTLNAIAVLTFEPGEPYPRLSRAVMSELGEILASLRSEDAFRGVVIAANSNSFATGAEIEEIAALEGICARELAAAGQGLFERIAHFPVPVIAAIRGFCMGGGFDLALACHQRVATYGASFGHPGASLGLMTGWGGTQRLSRWAGKSAALQILLTGERIPATQALTLGLVHELTSSNDLVDCAARRAQRLADSWNAGCNAMQKI
ncbi:MAG TPA: enoyl-CoA hydratase/isomerase family protein [Terriglobia bacterium]|nr:enoyl-CoA hydratase/isomerase family protein [Terriglobia bacterium]